MVIRHWGYTGKERENMSREAAEYRAGIARLNGAKGRLGVAYGPWQAGRDATATRPQVPARQEVYGIYGVDRSTGDITRVYVELEGHKEPGGILVGLPLGGPGWRPPVRFWVEVDHLASLALFEDAKRGADR